MTDNLKNFLGSELAGMWADGDRLAVSAGGGFHDYSFMIFPFAKVYEGFLKKLFLQLGAINDHQYNSNHWRVGKALNPQLEKELRVEESVYDRILNLCNNPKLPNILWCAWKNGRNKVFHFFPRENKYLTFEEAREAINEINNAMELALMSCPVAKNNHENSISKIDANIAKLQ